MAGWGDCRAGASAGTERNWRSRLRTGDDRSSSMSTARCPMRRCGSTDSSSAAGRMAITPGGSISRRMFVRRRQPARDPARQSAGIRALVSGRRALPQRLAGQGQPRPCRALGHASSPRRKCRRPRPPSRIDVTVDNDGAARLPDRRRRPQSTRSMRPVGAPAGRSRASPLAARPSRAGAHGAC